MIDPIAVIGAHIPSLTDEDEEEIINLAYSAEACDLAIRTCACGKHINGFYEYAVHLKVELRKAAEAEAEKCVQCGIFPKVKALGGTRHLCQQCLDLARRRFGGG